ncbi:hypothetical protein HPT27_12200 [Permianibacter sp. IMCC34836]|uniref:hypothetical protein n=1 Tax=Permianibacter fluminis TaxID=2738515 RepID=UPI00155524CA|nr:hypothetical protein [Permianibacter fluminis]NQD37789.1 hypothetical protein [Permianibacter fluminis]
MMFGEGFVNLPIIMRTRTPPTLFWLLDKRARLSGKIAYIEDKLQTFAVLAEKAQRLKKDLEVIDHTISLYEIPVDPTMVQPIKPILNSRLLAWGRMTRAIYMCLASDKEKAFKVLEIATFVIHNEGVEFSEVEFVEFRKAIRHRLRNLLRDGKVTRLNGREGLRDPYWQFKAP